MPESADKADTSGLRTEHLMADLKGRSIRGGAVTLSAQACKFLLQTGSTMILARLLEPADFGLVAMCAAFTGFVSLFKDLGLSTATIQRAEISHAQVSTLFWINIGASVVLMGIAAAMAPIVMWFYGEPKLGWITVIVATTFIFGGLTAQHTALLQRLMRFRDLAYIEIGAMLTGIATAITMALLGSGYWSLVGLTAGTALGNCILVWLFSDWRPGWPKRRSGIRPMLAFGGDLTIANIFHHLGRSAASVLIGRFLGASSVGLYSKAYGLVLLPSQQLLAPMGSVMLPVLSRLAGEPERFRRAALTALRLVAVLTVPTVAMLIVVSDWVVLVVLGPSWIEASQLFRILCVAAMLSPLNGVLSWIMTALGQTRGILKWSVMHNLLVVGSIGAGLHWGLVGVAISFALTGIVLRMPLFYWIVSRVSPLSVGDFYRTILPYLGIAVVLCGALAGLRALTGELNPFIGLPLFLTVGICLYLGILLALPGERGALRQVLTLRKSWSGGSPNF